MVRVAVAAEALGPAAVVVVALEVEGMVAAAWVVRVSHYRTDQPTTRSRAGLSPRPYTAC